MVVEAVVRLQRLRRSCRRGRRAPRPHARTRPPVTTQRVQGAPKAGQLPLLGVRVVLMDFR